MAEKRIEYYDSMGNQNIGVYKVRAVHSYCDDMRLRLCPSVPLQRLRSYLEAEYAAKNPGKELDLSDWENYWDEVRIAREVLLLCNPLTPCFRVFPIA